VSRFGSGIDSEAAASRPPDPRSRFGLVSARRRTSATHDVVFEPDDPHRHPPWKRRPRSAPGKPVVFGAPARRGGHESAELLAGTADIRDRPRSRPIRSISLYFQDCSPIARRGRSCSFSVPHLSSPSGLVSRPRTRLPLLGRDHHQLGLESCLPAGWRSPAGRRDSDSQAGFRFPVCGAAGQFVPLYPTHGRRRISVDGSTHLDRQSIPRLQLAGVACHLLSPLPEAAT
jgi:hypothetical protein